jgi:hypothetical protein
MGTADDDEADEEADAAADEEETYSSPSCTILPAPARPRP